MTAGTALFVGLIAATAAERVVELALSRRNAAIAFAQGGREHGRGHYPFMVALHAGFLAGALAEAILLRRAVPPAFAATMLGVALAAQALRWWAISTLGPRWNTRVIVVPGAPRVEGGPYRYAAHPNYVAVVVEGLALPLAGGAFITAAAFTLLNALLLAVRIRCEEAALESLTAGGRS